MLNYLRKKSLGSFFPSTENRRINAAESSSAPALLYTAALFVYCFKVSLKIICRICNS